MKIITYLLLAGLLIILSLPTISYSQASQPANDAQQIQMLQAKLDSMSQYFKQREDFKKEIEKEASAQVEAQLDKVISEWLGPWVLFFGALAFIIGIFGYKEIQKFLLDRMDNRIKQVMSENYEKMTLDQNKFMIKFESETYKDNYTKAPRLDAAKKLVEKAKKTEDKDLVGEVLDNLILAYFYKPDYKTLTELVLQYEKDVQNPTSWANASIASMEQYKNYNAKQYRESSLKYADRALNLLPDYGVPYAVKLIILMINYDRVKEIDLKKELIKEAKQIIDSVNGGVELVSSYETFQYLEDCGSRETFKPYYLHLFDVLPNEMNEMQKRFIIHNKKIHPYSKEGSSISEKALSDI